MKWAQNFAYSHVTQMLTLAPKRNDNFKLIMKYSQKTFIVIELNENKTKQNKVCKLAMTPPISMHDYTSSIQKTLHMNNSHNTFEYCVVTEQ